MPTTNPNTVTAPRLNGCLLLLVGLFALVFVGVCGFIGKTWWEVGSAYTEGGGITWVIDPDPAHPGFARAMPTVNGIGRADKQFSLDVTKPFAVPYGCISTNTTTGTFTPVCPQESP